MKNVALHNLGCKVNSYEIEVMQQMLQEKGYNIVPFDEVADIYIVNTCTVTNIADRKSRQMLHRAKQLNPDAIVVAVGCYVQTGKEAIEKDASIDLCIGNNRKKDIATILEEYLKERGELTEEGTPARRENKTLHGTTVPDIAHTYEYEEAQLHQTAEHTRAYIKIQDGCNQFCSYCAIPLARGRVRSRKAEDVLQEAETMAEKGYQEIVLTGIHLSSYGIDFEDEAWAEGKSVRKVQNAGDTEKEQRLGYTGESKLVDLVERLCGVEGIQRIRIGSLEPRVVTTQTAKRLATQPKVCPHFHLSLQSGCDETLERMNRRYRSGEYRERCELLREVYGNPALTTDVIVGFPQESEEEFQKSYDFVDGIHFYETHIFKYSRRQGTKAAAMDGQLTEAEKSFRSEKMIELHHRHAGDYEKSMIGKELEVLIEEEYTKDGRTWYLGHSREYIKTAVPKSEAYGVNDIVIVKAEGFLEEHIMTGEAVE